MSEAPLQIAPSLIGGVALLYREVVPDWQRLPRKVSDMLASIGAGKSQAYQSRDRLRDTLPTLLGSPGRPPSPPSRPEAEVAVLKAVLTFTYSNAGAVVDGGERRTYSDDFRRFVVGLTGPGQVGEGMAMDDLAKACCLPMGTVKGWMRPQPVRVEELPLPFDLPSVGGEADGTVANDVHESNLASGMHPVEDLAAAVPVEDEALPSESASECTESENPRLSDFVTIRMAHLHVIAAHWLSWKGPFQAFCRMLRTQQRLQYGDTFIGNFLQSIGLRYRRPRVPTEAPWSSNTFTTLFPGVQWLGDGTSLLVRWGTESFVFTVEALMDAAADAVVGFDVADSENEEALRRAFDAGIETAGTPPLATTLDNRPSNHSPATLDALTGTTVLRATAGRGQAKAPLEGHFGLFQQTMPPLVVGGDTPREMARSFLTIVLAAWFRGRNGKPRKRLDGRTPAEAYQNAKPSAEEILEALDWISELQRREEKARQTREARCDKVRLVLLQTGLVEFDIADPQNRLAVSLARFSRDAIVRGLATFKTKQGQGTIPAEAHNRGAYLGGIIRNLHIRLELEELSEQLMQQRIRLGDLTLEPLKRSLNQLRAEVPSSALPQACLDRTLDASIAVDFRFWAGATVEALKVLPTAQRAALYRPLCRRIAASFKTDRQRREDLIDRLADGLASAA